MSDDGVNVPVQIDRIRVAEWIPNNMDRPTQVHILIVVPEVEATFAVRLKSRRGALALIADLQSSVDSVWPPE